MGNQQYWEPLDWSALERLRAAFLDGTAAQGDYWRKSSDLQAYDRTFGRRIGWKWQFVLDDLAHLAWSPPPGTVLDWGCGSGNAGRTFLKQFGTNDRRLLVADRSLLAVQYARGRAAEEFPSLNVQIAQGGATQPCDVLLVSHVINEISQQQLEGLLAQCAAATAVIWVEPGTHEDSRKLIAVRERLVAMREQHIGQFHVVSPCTHQGACGMLAEGCERHWCHFFATSPPEVHTDGNWVKFGRLAGIDLRACPLSFLVLDKRPAPDKRPVLDSRPVPPIPADAVRILGRARIYKAYALLFGCDQSGIRDRRVMKRHFPEEFRELKRGRMKSLRTGPWE